MSDETPRITVNEYFSMPGINALYKTEDLKDHNSEVVGYSSSEIFVCHFVKKDPVKSTFTPVLVNDIRFATVKTSFRLWKVIIGLIMLIFGLGWIILFLEGRVEVIFYWIAGLSALGGLIGLLTPFEHHAVYNIEGNKFPLKSRELSFKSKRKLARFMRESGRLA